MSAMSASPPVGLPLSLIPEHKVVSASKPIVGGSSTVPAGGAVANGVEQPPSPHPPTAEIPSLPLQPSSPPPSINSSVQGVSQSEGPVAPGSGNNTSGGSGEVEANSVVGDVPPADAQPCVPSTPATVPIPQEPILDQADGAVEADPAPHPLADTGESSDRAAHPVVPANIPVTEPSQPEHVVPEPSAPVAATPPQEVPIQEPNQLLQSISSTPAQENVKPSRPLKRKAQTENKKVNKSTEEESQSDDVKKSKRMRLPTQPYQSPIPELNLIAKMNNTPKQNKPQEEKLIVFYRNEFLAVRNAEGGFYVCQAMQNIYRGSSKIKIRWFTHEANDTFTPDFYDTTEFDCILTNLNLDKLEKDKYKLPELESQRTLSILKRAIDVEKGVAPASDSALTEEHPDGLDLSLYRHEDQLKKRRKSKKVNSKPKPKTEKPVGANSEPKKLTRNNSGGLGSNASTGRGKQKANKRKGKSKSIGGKKSSGAKAVMSSVKKKVPGTPLSGTVVKRESERPSRRSAASSSNSKSSTDNKTKSAAQAVTAAPSTRAVRSSSRSAAALPSAAKSA